MKQTYFDNKIKSTCNGCGACSLICPVNAIKMQEDSEGFLYPIVDEEKCIKCNKCRNVCSNFNTKQEKNEKAYASINKSKEQLNEASSGGMYYLLADYVINNNGVVCGVTYNEDLEVVHEFAETMQECRKFCGSKYVRSNLQDSYLKVKEFLENDRYVLFTGTACQVNGLKQYLGKEYEKLILCDILCHANPSPKVFKMYIKNLEIKKNKKVKMIYFRIKENGWKNENPIIEYEDGEREEENSYIMAFSKELINRPSCHSCQFASKRRISDFTIGDFWGIDKVLPKLDISNGVSLLTVNTAKGANIFDNIKEKMICHEVDYEIASIYNHYSNVKPHENREKFFKDLSNSKINEQNMIESLRQYRKRKLYKRIVGRITSIIQRQVNKMKITFNSKSKRTQLIGRIK